MIRFYLSILKFEAYSWYLRDWYRIEIISCFSRHTISYLKCSIILHSFFYDVSGMSQGRIYCMCEITTDPNCMKNLRCLEMPAARASSVFAVEYTHAHRWMLMESSAEDRFLYTKSIPCCSYCVLNWKFYMSPPYQIKRVPQIISSSTIHKINISFALYEIDYWLFEFFHRMGRLFQFSEFCKMLCHFYSIIRCFFIDS